jgi:hypothetical protein
VPASSDDDARDGEASSASRLTAAVRPGVASVEIDGDIVVYDVDSATSHVLTGGAVVVWQELTGGDVDDLVRRVALRTGSAPDAIADEVRACVVQLDSLGLLASSDRESQC